MKNFFLILIVAVIAVLGYRYFIQGKTDFRDLTEVKNPFNAEVIKKDEVNDADTTLLEGASWAVSAIGSEMVTDAGITAEFKDGTVGGKDGCNYYSTQYSRIGDVLTINNQIAGTLMACSEPTMVLASLYTQTLGSVASYTIERDTLNLRNDEGVVVITLQKISQSLVDTTWKIDGYNNGKDSIVSPLGQAELTVAFDETGISGAACNSFSGEYSLGENNDITIGDLAVTRMLCMEPSGVMEQETMYLQALQNATRYERAMDRLTLLDSEGNTLITAEIVLPL